MNHFPKDVLPVVESMGSAYFHEEQYYQLEKRNKKEESKVFFQVKARVQFISFEILILKMTNKMFQVLFLIQDARITFLISWSVSYSNVMI